MKVLVAVACILLISMSSYYFITGYRSAFEADQACHSEQWNSYAENSNFACDHDLETSQWILYEALSNHEPARVIRRFRY